MSNSSKPSFSCCDWQSPFALHRRQVVMDRPDGFPTSTAFSGPFNQTCKKSGEGVKTQFIPSSSDVPILTIENNKYTFAQYHFHVPAEHHLDDIIYSSVMHVVFVSESTDRPFAVLGFFFSISDSAKDDSMAKGLLKGTLDFNSLAIDRPHIYCLGGLTTPPFTTGVHWHLFDETPLHVSQSFVDSIVDMHGQATNVRELQPLNDRGLYRSSLVFN